MSLPVIVVTGGAGFIGSHVCKLLAAEGMLPVTIDNLSTGRAHAVRYGPLEIADTRDTARIHTVLERWAPRAIIHMADVSSVAESVAEPARYHDNNITGSLSLFRAAAAQGCRQIIYSSSASVYAPPSGLRALSEDSAIAPCNPYGETKVAVELALRDLAESDDFRAIAFRFFNAAGADPAGELGEEHAPETHLIPIVLEVARGKRPVLAINGGDFPTSDGTAIRDYVHVEDIARAHLLGLTALSESRGGTMAAYNLGNGQGYSVREIVAAARAVTGRAIATEVASRRTGDPAILVADSGLARARLGWTPRHPDIETQIAHAWSWYLKQDSAQAAPGPALAC
jgi:UDP-glucose-4-epimerase GalE